MPRPRRCERVTDVCATGSSTQHRDAHSGPHRAVQHTPAATEKRHMSIARRHTCRSA